MSVQGEMGATVFRYPRSWSGLLRAIRARIIQERKQVRSVDKQPVSMLEAGA